MSISWNKRRWDFGDTSPHRRFFWQAYGDVLIHCKQDYGTYGILVGFIQRPGGMTLGNGVLEGTGNPVSVGGGSMGMGTWVSVGSGVSVGMGMGVLVSVGSGVPVGMGVQVFVGSGVSVGVGVLVSVGSGVSVGVGVSVSVGRGVAVGGGVSVFVGRGVLVGEMEVDELAGGGVLVGCGIAVLPGSLSSGALPGLPLARGGCTIKASTSSMAVPSFSKVILINLAIRGSNWATTVSAPERVPLKPASSE